MRDPDVEDVSAETLTIFVKKAVNMLLEKQVSSTLVLSSHKINTILRNRFGKNFKIDRIGRCLAKLAKQNKLKRLGTKIPKYEVRTSKFRGFQLPD